MAGLAQTLVAWCLDRIAEDRLPHPPTQWSVKQNRWLAARHGIDAELIVEQDRADPPTGHAPSSAAYEVGGRMVERAPLRQLLSELVELLRPTAERLGTTGSLDDVIAMAERGSGTDRQRAVIAGGGTLRDVVDHLVDEFASDTPTIR